MPTVSEIISIAKVSEYLAAVDIYKAGINFGGNDVGLPRKLYCIRKNVEKVYDLDPTDDTLTQTANYLFSLCNRYAFKAQSILNIASGGTIAPVTPSGGDVPEPLDFLVNGTTPVITGATSATLTDFIGYNIDFYRGGFIQYTTNPGGGALYYGWNKVTGIFQLLGTNPGAVAGEQFRIVAVS